MRAIASRRQGFTLVELLLVTVILGILASIAIPRFTAIRERAFISSMRADLRNLANLQAVYYNDHYSYSSNATSLGHYPSEGVTLDIPEADNVGWSASAVHAGAPNQACAIFHGDATPVAPATVVSSVQCGT